jgi:hypothetical protein
LAGAVQLEQCSRSSSLELDRCVQGVYSKLHDNYALAGKLLLCPEKEVHPSKWG